MVKCIICGRTEPSEDLEELMELDRWIEEYGNYYCGGCRDVYEHFVSCNEEE